MKLFGWGRKKEPPPTSHDEPVKQAGYGVSARNNCKPGTTGWRSRDIELQDWLPKDHDYDQREMALPRPEAPEVAWEDRLQETIRFVFSHEQEGLLAIGTFALDDLAGARLFGLDMIVETSRKSDPSSCTSAISSMQQLEELQHSDVDYDDAALTEFCQQKRKELPVFGDHDALIDLQHPVVESNVQVLPIIQVVKPSSSGADTEVVVTNQKLTGVQQKEKREEKLLYVSGVLGSATTEHYDDGDEESYSRSPALCGLFPSRSRRSQLPKPIEKEKRKKLLPLESEANDVKKCVRSKGFCTSLARLWRSGCHGPPAATAEVSPEPQLLRSESSQSQGSGVPCIANVEPELPKLVPPAQAVPKQSTAAGEGGERKRRGHSFGKGSWACAQNGKWIRTDSEFVVLEM